MIAYVLSPRSRSRKEYGGQLCSQRRRDVLFIRWVLPRNENSLSEAMELYIYWSSFMRGQVILSIDLLLKFQPTRLVSSMPVIWVYLLLIGVGEAHRVSLSTTARFWEPGTSA